MSFTPKLIQDTVPAALDELFEVIQSHNYEETLEDYYENLIKQVLEEQPDLEDNEKAIALLTVASYILHTIHTNTPETTYNTYLGVMFEVGRNFEQRKEFFNMHGTDTLQ